MRIDRSPFKKKLFHPPGIVAIGYFDALHLGHQRLLDALLEIADEKHLKPYVLTFDMIPQKEKNGKCLLTVENRLKTIPRVIP